jgi:riboflavin synthase
MFTGLIKEVGTIIKVTPNSEGSELLIDAPKLAEQIGIDDSVAVNGTCLTATKIAGSVFTTQAVHVTLEKTNIGSLKVGDFVNLELALLPTDRLGGHFVQGHVNGVATFKSFTQRGDNFELTFELPDKLMKYMMDEGSIAIDGISLTCAKVEGNLVTVSIIPHTWANTNLFKKKVGDQVNIEADVLAKYIENLLKFEGEKEITADFLKQSGY